MSKLSVSEQPPLTQPKHATKLLSQAEVLRFPQPWIFEQRLTPRAIGLALAIAQWTLPANRGGFCYYSAAKLADRLGWTPRTVERGLADLRKVGILERNRRGIRIVRPTEVAEHTDTIVGNKERNTDSPSGATTKPNPLTEPMTKRESSSDVTRSSVETEPKASPSQSQSKIETKKEAQKLVDLFNDLAEEHGITRRERVSRAVIRAVITTDANHNERLQAVEGLFAESDGWALSRGHGIHQTLKRWEYFAGIGAELQAEREKEQDFAERLVQRQRAAEARANCVHEFDPHERPCKCGGRVAGHPIDRHGVCTLVWEGLKCVRCGTEEKQERMSA